MSDLETYLKGQPLNGRMAALMESQGEEDEAPIQPAPALEVRVRWAPDDEDREHLRRLLLEPGWRVLLKLLDNEQAEMEDAAKRNSFADPLGELNKVWAGVAYFKKARDRIIALIETEVEKLKDRTKKNHGAILGR